MSDHTQDFFFFPQELFIWNLVLKHTIILMRSRNSSSRTCKKILLSDYLIGHNTRHKHLQSCWQSSACLLNCCQCRPGRTIFFFIGFLSYGVEMCRGFMNTSLLLLSKLDDLFSHSIMSNCMYVLVFTAHSSWVAFRDTILP